VEAHMRSYIPQYNILAEIERYQSEHNNATSKLMAERETEIRRAISGNEDISIPDWKSSDDRSFYKLNKIFEHFMEEAYQHKELEITDYTTYNGREYHKLFRKSADFIAVAEKKNLESLKELIDSEPTICELKKLLEEINTMQYLLNCFGEGISDILHYVPTNGLEGQCLVEQKLRGRIGRFLRRMRRN
jgi:hypothetical protein